MTYVKPTSDMFIKYLLGREENKDLLITFINAVLEDSEFPLIQSVEIKNPFNLKEILTDKETVLDIKAIDENGKIYNIEIQTSGSVEFTYRSLYYWSKLYSAQLQEGFDYSQLFPVICINLLEFNLFKEVDRYHLHFMLFEIKDPEFVLTDHLSIHFLELPKFHNLQIEKTLERWLYYLKNEGKSEEDENMKILLKHDPDLQKARQQYTNFTLDDKLVDAYEAHMKWKRDYHSLLNAAKREGLKEGHDKGRDEGLKEGRDKGLKEGSESILLEVVQAKFGNIDAETKQKIKQIDSRESLQALIKELFNIDSQEDFKKLVGGFLSSE